LAKYNSAGQYVWAFNLGGTGLDVGRDIALDPSGNVYVAGDFNGSNIDFDPSASVATLSSVGGSDVFLAKYNSAGQYQWAKRYGSSGNDIGWSVAYATNNVYIAGSFQGTINFNPGPGVDNLTSNGSTDVYLTKFDENGVYKCAFSIGGTGADEGYRVYGDLLGNIYVTGSLGSANTDFNPTTAQNLLSTNGGSDIHMAKYNWPDNTAPTGTISGNSICTAGQQGKLTFNATNGVGPFTIQYSNGTTTFTENNVQSGVPFNLSPNPVVTTTYTLVSIKDGTRCSPTNNVSGITTTVNVSTVPSSVDFSYTQDICNPNSVQFSSLSLGATNFVWNFGNSTTNLGSASPTVTYSSLGTYSVKLRIQQPNGCLDSTTKNIPVNLQQDNSLIATNNQSICAGASVSLNLSDTGLIHCWSPVTGISNVNSSTPTITPAATTTYYYTSQTLGSNLIVNGDFSAGNTGFQSNYLAVSPNTTAAQYWIGSNPNAWLAGFPSCTDHTSGTGNMMLVNGSTTVGAKVWEQTISVTPNTNYAFSTWVQSLNSTSPANLRFSINGNILSNTINASSTTCLWNRFFATWNTGNSSVAVITIINNNNAFSGNDFALDDISFSPVVMKQDSVAVNVVSCTSVAASFTAPDTVCVNTPVNISNVSAGASTYYWNFCVANINTIPTGVNLGNINNEFVIPVFMDVVFDNGNYYGFVTNNFPGKLTRLDFGNSLLNAPVAVNLGNVGGVIPDAVEGIQVIKNEGTWYAIIVGGNASVGGSRITRINFGSNITNTSPIGTNWGNIGSMDYPHDLHIFQDGSNWYGLTVNYNNHTITRFSFGTSFNATPTAVNLGNIGNLNRPSGINAVFNNNKWYVFVSNRDGNTLTRLDFGTSLLNVPTGTNLGNISGTLNAPRDFFVINFCGGLIGYLLNEANNLVKFDFNQNIESVPTGVSLGNIGNMSFPVCITKLFRVGADLYSFVTNATNNSISRLKFTGCTNSSIPNSTLQTPTPFTYNSPGTYNINLTTDEGLSTESTICKQVVVVSRPVHSATQTISVCSGDSVTLNSNFANATYVWSTGATASSIKAKTAGTYWVESTVTGGCSVRDSIVVTVLSCTSVAAVFTAPDTVCVNTPVNINNVSPTSASTYYWNFCVANINAAPTGINLGNVNSQFATPVFMDVAFDNGNYYAFVTNNFPGKLTRLDFGNSLLNAPTAVNLGNVGGIIPDAVEGIQIIKNEGTWYAIIVGGTTTVTGGPRIVRINFGSNITNTSPVGTNWGNIGGLDYPHDLHVFQDGSNWYGFTVSLNNNTITRFNFGTSFNAIPTAVNLGNIGTLNAPSGINAVFSNNKWYVFVSNRNGNSLTRLDFGASLLNIPTGTNLGNISGTLNAPRDFFVINYCGAVVGYLVNEGNNSLIKLDFNQNIESAPIGVSLGNIGSMSFPVCITKLFRVGADLYSFVTNATNNSISRLKFTGCTNSSIPNSSLQTPPAFTYNTPGTYNINLTTDEGLSTQSSFCKQVVVVAPPAHAVTKHFGICNGDSVTISSNFSNAAYLWSTGAVTNSIKAKTAGTYWVESTVTGGCSVRDSFVVNIASCNSVTAAFTAPDTVCVNKPVNIVNTSSGTSSQYWSFCSSDLSTVSPIATSFGNPGSLLDIPVSIDYALYNGNYYGFITNNGTTPGLIRLDYGNSLLNTPTLVSLGNFGGNFPRSMQGLQLINTNGKWYLVVVGGDMNISVQSRVMVFDFGTVLTNASPTYNSWLSIGAMDYPTGLHVFQSGTNWYGLTTNAWSGTITRLSFGSNFSSVTATNLGVIGSTNIPTGLFPIKEGNNYYLFIANTGNSTLTRLDFGNSLLNIPTGVNLGTLGGALSGPRDLHIFRDCNQTVGFVLNGTSSSLARLNFSTLTSTPTATSLGNPGGFSNPIAFSRIFRDGSDIYSFLVNANNSFGKLKFAGCNIPSPLGSSLPTPPAITYSTPGTYTIKLSVDDGLETEGGFCKPIVVVAPPVHSATQNISFCQGDSATLNSNFINATYLWSNGAVTSSIKAKTAGTYWVESTITGGCTVRDSMVITLKAVPSVYAGTDAFICGSDSALLNATGTGSFSWSPTSGLNNPAINNPKAHPSTNTDYIVTLTAANGCMAKDTVTVTVLSGGASIDFSYSQDICNPKTIQFFNSTTGAASLTWDFGNSTTNTGSSNPTVTYAAYGTYPVKLKIGVANGCVDSVTKNIPVNMLQDNNLIVTNDLSVCAGSSTSLNIQDTGLNHCWQPVTGISNVNSATPTITPAATTTYYFTSQTLGNNLVANGDFSAGNTGFTSEYISAFPNAAEGQYFIGNNPLAWNGGLTACTEHTTGTGQMMMVNGSPIANAKIWTQTIPVTPNANYAFSTWIESLHAINPANVKFSINGNIIGNNITAGSVACQWSRFFTTWNSGNSTTATISIVNNNTIAVGNDFALDDISFSPVIMKQDSIKITVTQPPTVTGSAIASSICEADSSQLSATGAANFSWSPTTGLSNPNIANPKASPAVTTTYTVSGNNVAGCDGTNTVTVTIKPKPIISKSADANICKDSTVTLAASSTNVLSYSWLPITGLNNPSSNNPLATPASTTNYIVTVTGTNGCVNKDSVLVTVLAKPTVQVRIDTTVCNKVPIILTTTNTGASSFSWLPASGLSSTISPNPVATPTVSTQYIVTASNGSCFSKDTINLGIKPLPTITKSIDTIICKAGTASLSVSGGTAYAWTPIYALGNPSSGTTTANPDTTVKYFVAVTGSNACVNTDSILVTVNPKPVFSLQPASATICKGDSVLLTASGGDLYAWVPNTNIVSATAASTKVYPPVATLYKVGITNSICKVTDTLSSFISLNGSLATSVSSSNNIDCSHGQSVLHATGGVNYEWTIAPGIANLLSPSPIVVPTQTTTYYVKVTDAKGCTGYDSVKVNVDFTANASLYLLPTAFTPDGNGNNDCFGLKFWGVVTQLDFNIYSRWGQLVFHTSNPSDCWDGRLNGQPQDGGTFVYQIKAKTACGEIYRKGTIILIR
jgi:gliding motility-associated-like protein